MQFVDAMGEEHMQLALIGDKNVHMLRGVELGLSTDRNERAGSAVPWLRDAVFEAISQAVNKE